MALLPAEIFNEIFDHFWYPKIHSTDIDATSRCSVCYYNNLQTCSLISRQWNRYATSALYTSIIINRQSVVCHIHGSETYFHYSNRNSGRIRMTKTKGIMLHEKLTKVEILDGGHRIDKLFERLVCSLKEHNRTAQLILDLDVDWSRKNGGPPGNNIVEYRPDPNWIWDDVRLVNLVESCPNVQNLRGYTLSHHVNESYIPFYTPPKWITDISIFSKAINSPLKTIYDAALACNHLRRLSIQFIQNRDINSRWDKAVATSSYPNLSNMKSLEEVDLHIWYDSLRDDRGYKGLDIYIREHRDNAMKEVDKAVLEYIIKLAAKDSMKKIRLTYPDNWEAWVDEVILSKIAGVKAMSTINKRTLMVEVMLQR